ncbi:tandem-95 repeat protein [Vibrio diabolicus]|uniref:tandem-95 repeat protein n=1 Tax=Vibrio diabolicus TaxID=50719 RepID=UPI000ADD7B59|nr:tandem-95 repeat protein [Vibrio diabolicus]
MAGLPGFDNYVGKDTFTYVVTSGGVSEFTTVEVNVTPVNDAPVAKDDIATTQEDTAVTIDVLPNDTDVDDDKLSIESASVPKEQGTVEVVDGKLVFTPAENFNGDAEITYIVTDGQLTDEAKVVVSVNPVNDAPTIKVDAVESITEDAVSTDTVVATLTVRDTDTPEDQLTVSLENNSNGYFVLVGNEVKLTQAGVDAVNNDELNLKDLTISASVSDGVNPTASDSDSLVVNRVNDAPTVDNAITDQVLSEDFATYTIDLNDAFKDSDSVLSFSVAGNSNVLVSIENGIATISPTADWNGSEILTFTATDPNGESVSQTVNFTVAPVADIVALCFSRYKQSIGMDKKVELALEAIKASRGTESGEYGIDLFVSHHLDELPAAVWLEILGKENPSFDDILSALVVAYVEDDVCDFTLPNDVTNYLISVSFDENGQVIDISMES